MIWLELLNVLVFAQRTRLAVRHHAADLGIAEGKRKSFRNVTHGKRRKRWLA